jgi:hypothetical protein
MKFLFLLFVAAAVLVAVFGTLPKAVRDAVPTVSVSVSPTPVRVTTADGVTTAKAVEVEASSARRDVPVQQNVADKLKSMNAKIRQDSGIDTTTADMLADLLESLPTKAPNTPPSASSQQ